MYRIVYYVRTTENEEVYENEYQGEEFRLRKDALHFLRETSVEVYIENEYTIEDVKNGLNCYKSKKNAKGERETIETRIRIEKI